MTTLFPQIKRVDEDETSKIIKNVLFNNQDEIKLEKIFNEFMHLTEELPFSDDDEDEDDDDNANTAAPDDDCDDEGGGVDDDDRTHGRNNGGVIDNNVVSDSDEEDDDSNSDDDDEDGDDSEDDDDGDSSDESEDEERESTPPREPTSWNLDQFIKSIPAKQKQPTQATQQQHHQVKQEQSVLTPPPPPPSTQQHQQPIQLKQQTITQQPLPQPKAHKHKVVETPVVIKREPKVEPPQEQSPPEIPDPLQSKQSLSLTLSQKPQPTPSPLSQKQQPTPSPPQPTQPNNHHQNHQHKHKLHKQTSGGSCLVSIDLSKLKRIPNTKAPTPTMTGSKSILTAKALKHEADAEKDKTKQAIKYLESAMYFVLHGQELEGTPNSSSYYHDIIPLFKHVRRLSTSSNPENPDNMTSLKIYALTQKCLSILYTKLYRLKERELPELAKMTSSFSNNSPIQQADEVLIGVKPSFLSAYKRQLAIYDNLKYAHENWHNVEHLCDQHPALKIFFSTIESNCGSLTMICSFSKLMEHVQCGLKLLRTS